MALKPLFPATFINEAVSAVLDFASYRGIFRQPLLRSLLYLLQLTVVSSLILTAAYSFRLIPQFDHFLSWAETALPPFRVENGQLHVDVESPASFQYPGNHLVTFVFDTREKHIVPESLDQPALLFTREVLFLPFLGQPITWPWPQVETLFSNSEVGITVNPETLEEMRRSLSWMTPAFFLFSLGISMFSKLFQAVLLIFLGILASSSRGVRLPIVHYLTIAIYALTPATAIDSLVIILGQASDLFEMIYLLTAAVYTYLATQRCLGPE